MHTTSLRRPVSSPKLVKVGIVGLDARARLFADAAVRSDKLKIIAGFSRTAEKRRTFQGETRVPVVSDLKTLLSYPMLDGVILTVPADQQLALAAEIAKAKKHILIAGAVGSTLQEAREIAALELKYGVAVAAGHFACKLGGIARMREAIRKGELGTVALIEANFSKPSGVEGDEDSDGSEVSDSVLRAMAIEQYDILEYLGGEIVEVSAMASGFDGPSEGLAGLTSLLKFADGKLGYVGCSRSSPGLLAMRVFGSKGVMHFETDMGVWSTPEKRQEASALYLHRDGVGGKRENVMIPPTDTFAAQLKMFAEACRTGKSGEFSVTSAVNALTVADAAARALEKRGQSVRVERVDDGGELRPRSSALLTT